jgi:hypothetical protein
MIPFQDLDLICAPLVMTAERDDVIDFIIPYIEQTGISIGLMQRFILSKSVVLIFNSHSSVEAAHLRNIFV